MDREPLLRRRRELYQQRREREMPEEREVLRHMQEIHTQLIYLEHLSHQATQLDFSKLSTYLISTFL